MHDEEKQPSHTHITALAQTSAVTTVCATRTDASVALGQLTARLPIL